MEASELHARLKALVNTWAPFEGRGRLSIEAQEWLGRVHALITQAGHGADAMIFGSAVAGLGTPLHSSHVQTIHAILFRTLAMAELAAPVAYQGAFISVASPFNTFASFSRILSVATQDVLIVDPYLDAVTLTDVAVLIPEHVTLRLLGDQANIQVNLAPAVTRWRAQHTNRPLEARHALPKALHDRIIFVDDHQAWSLSQSIKDFAKRSPASIERSPADLTEMKKQAYEGAWLAASPFLLHAE